MNQRKEKDPGLTRHQAQSTDDYYAEMLRRAKIELGLQQPSKVICSWCGRVLREGVEPVSHGICKDCRRGYQQEVKNGTAKSG